VLTNFPSIIPRSLIALAFLLPSNLEAKDALKLTDGAEQKAWETLAERFKEGPEYKKNEDGAIISARMKDYRKSGKKGGWFEIQIDPKSGHVVKVSSDRASLSNEELALLASFEQLETLTLWHNQPANKDDNEDRYDGKGLAALTKLSNLTDITLAGGAFDDDGMAAAAKLPHLKYLGIWHTDVTDVGLIALKDHPTFERIKLGPFWRERITDAGMAALAEVPNLKEVVIGETWLTFPGLASFIPLDGQLKELDLSNTLIEPGAVEKLRRKMSKTDIEWEGLQGAGEVLDSSKWQRQRLKDWAPNKLVESAIKAADRDRK